MKNLKRALSFALATVMVIGMMVVGAGAAFTDADEIVNDEAVNTLVTLGVINGKGDGSYFDPTGIVTRAEMAKMITVALNGGKNPVLGTKTTPSYTDIKGTWAEAYIEYCSALGIIAGKGDGTFAPTATVTGTEAAKMILVALGYDAETEKFVNDGNWAININSVASSKELYEELETIDPAQGLTRDNAAQMIWNGMQTKMVEYDYKLVTDNGELNSIAVAGDVNKTILSSKFGMGTAAATLTAIDYDADEAEYNYTLTLGNGTVTYTTETDYTDLFALPATVLYKGTLTNKNIYGIYTDADKIAEGIIGKVTLTEVNNAVDGNAEKVKFDNVEYKLTQTVATTEVYAYNTAWVDNMSNIAAASKYDTFAAYDITDDGEADMIVWYPVSVAKVTFAGKESVTINGYSPMKYSENDIYDGIAKDDWVVITDKTNNVDTDKYVVTKADVVTGKVEATKGTKAQVNGTWYEKNGKTVDLGKTYDLAVVNGYVINADLSDESVALEELVYVVNKNGVTSTGIDAGTQKVQVMFTDGSKKTVTVSKINNSTPVNGVTQYALYSYEIDEDGYYELTNIDTNDYDDVDTSATSVTEGKTDTNTRFADDAVVFVKGNDDVKVMTGAEIKKWADNTAISAKLYSDKTNGYNYVVVGTVTVNANVPGASGKTVYGYVTSDVVATKDGDDTYYSFDVWTVNGTMSVKEKDSTNAAKNAFVSFENKGDGLVDGTVALTMKDGAVVAYDGEEIQIAHADGTYDLKINGADDNGTDTAILYIDIEEKVVAEGGEIALADKASNTTWTPNVKVYAASYADGSDIALLVVDTTNETGVAAVDGQ